MNVLIIGSGGREHALALKINKSKNLNNLYCIPGNPGTAELGKNINSDPSNFVEIAKFCKKEKIDIVLVGPEKPLSDGITNFLKNHNIKVFGPTKEAAQIESNKVFAKNLMTKYKIPTAKYKTFSADEYKQSLEHLKNVDFPIVVKASGLAAGKGVVICKTFEEAKIAVEDCFYKNKFGDAGTNVVIEEFLEGQEVSIFAITDGSDYKILPPSQDHKKIGEGDTGKNTGGMGAYAPTPFVDDEIMNEIEKNIITPTLEALKNEGFPFTGCLYGGLILTKEGPKVIEFNCRFGDPETQVVLPLLEGDLIDLLYSAAEGKIDKNAVKYNGGSALGVVLVSGGYPGKYEKGFEISGLEKIDGQGIQVIHAGTKIQDGEILTNGGRVLNVLSVLKENNLSLCKTKTYQAISKVIFEGIYYRKDIGDNAINTYR